MTTTPANAKAAALEALIEAHAVELKLPTVRRRFRPLAAEAVREQQTPVAYLAALLEAETAERAERRERRRLIDARFPQVKRLEDFHFADNPNVPPATIATLAEGAWIDDRESVILIGDSGRGRHTWRQRSRSAPAKPDAGCASQRSPPWPTSSRKPKPPASSPASSLATPAQSSWCSTKWDIWRCPTVPPSSSSKSSQSATNAAA